MSCVSASTARSPASDQRDDRKNHPHPPPLPGKFRRKAGRLCRVLSTGHLSRQFQRRREHPLRHHQQARNSTTTCSRTTAAFRSFLQSVGLLDPTPRPWRRTGQTGRGDLWRASTRSISFLRTARFRPTGLKNAKRILTRLKKVSHCPCPALADSNPFSCRWP